MTSKQPTTASSQSAGGLTPIHLDVDLSERADALLDNTGGVLDVALLPRIVPPAGGALSWSYSLLGNDLTSPELNLIVLASTKSRAYWSQPMGAGDVFPDCSSKDGVNGIGNPGGKCVTCPFSEWGSSDRYEDDRAQACREFRVLPALVLPELTMTLLRVPPTSTRAVDAYVQDLALAGHRISQVITRATLTRAESDKGIAFAAVKLEAVGKVSDDAHLKALGEIATMVRSAQVGTVLAETTLADA